MFKIEKDRFSFCPWNSPWSFRALVSIDFRENQFVPVPFVEFPLAICWFSALIDWCVFRDPRRKSSVQFEIAFSLSHCSCSTRFIFFLTKCFASLNENKKWTFNHEDFHWIDSLLLIRSLFVEVLLREFLFLFRNSVTRETNSNSIEENLSLYFEFFFSFFLFLFELKEIEIEIHNFIQNSSHFKTNSNFNFFNFFFQSLQENKIWKNTSVWFIFFTLLSWTDVWNFSLAEPSSSFNRWTSHWSSSIVDFIFFVCRRINWTKTFTRA